jgi:Uncharacterized conserved protein
MLFVLGLLLTLSGAVYAADGFKGPSQKGGFTGPSREFMQVKVAELEDLRDDTRVSLTGNITERVGDDDFIFTDGTGTVVLDVDDEAWYGLSIGPENTVTVYGKLDKGFTKMEVEVKRIEKRN